MEPPGRRYLCARCRTAVAICSHCDRGQRYCPACAEEARRQSVRAAGRRYQDSRRGRHAHAERQRRYRVRQKEAEQKAALALNVAQEVTHQGSPPMPPPVPLPTEPAAPADSPLWRCAYCQAPLPERVRQDFLRCRIRRHPLNRSTYGPHPRN